MRTMIINPTREQHERDFNDLSQIDYFVFNAGELPNDPHFPGTGTRTCVTANLTEKKYVVTGTQYAGEMKKGLFTVMNYLYPKRGILSMHASANEGPNGDTTILFGLSGTGKTTLSADPHRKLIGDDEHIWTDDGVINLEGGCYAKCIKLRREKEPEIFDAMRWGTVLENIDFKDPHSREVDWDGCSITENTRAAYPLEFIPSVKLPAYGGQPKNIFFLTCDAFGVLPPVSRLSFEQAMYHFISGYTAKVAGTEMGITEPELTFSACFGEAFLPLHPNAYAQLLAQRMKKHGTRAWLINTGWSGGKYGVGKRMDIKVTRAVLDAIHDGKLENVEYKSLPYFNVQVPQACPGVDQRILNPVATWSDKNEYDKTLRFLAQKFQENFKNYEDGAAPEIKNAGPKL